MIKLMLSLFIYLISKNTYVFLFQGNETFYNEKWGKCIATREKLPLNSKLLNDVSKLLSEHDRSTTK